MSSRRIKYLAPRRPALVNTPGAIDRYNLDVEEWIEEEKEWMASHPSSSRDYHDKKRFPVTPGSLLPELDWMVGQAFQWPRCEVCEQHHREEEDEWRHVRLVDGEVETRRRWNGYQEEGQKLLQIQYMRANLFAVDRSSNRATKYLGYAWEKLELELDDDDNVPTADEAFVGNYRKHNVVPPSDYSFKSLLRASTAGSLSPRTPLTSAVSPVGSGSGSGTGSMGTPLMGLAEEFARAGMEGEGEGEGVGEGGFEPDLLDVDDVFRASSGGRRRQSLAPIESIIEPLQLGLQLEGMSFGSFSVDDEDEEDGERRRWLEAGAKDGEIAGLKRDLERVVGELRREGLRARDLERERTRVGESLEVVRREVTGLKEGLERVKADKVARERQVGRLNVDLLRAQEKHNGLERQWTREQLEHGRGLELLAQEKVARERQVGRMNISLLQERRRVAVTEKHSEQRRLRHESQLQSLARERDAKERQIGEANSELLHTADEAVIAAKTEAQGLAAELAESHRVRDVQQQEHSERIARMQSAHRVELASVQAVLEQEMDRLDTAWRTELDEKAREMERLRIQLNEDMVQERDRLNAFWQEKVDESVLVGYVEGNDLEDKFGAQLEQETARLNAFWKEKTRESALVGHEELLDLEHQFDAVHAQEIDRLNAFWQEKLDNSMLLGYAEALHSDHELQELKDELQDARDANQSLEDELDTLEGRFEALETEHNELESDHQVQDQLVVDYERRIDVLEARVDEWMERASEREDECELLEGVIVDWDERAIPALKQRIADWENACGALEGTIEERDKTVEVMKAAIKSRDETIESRDKTIEVMNGTIESRNKTIETLRGTIESRDKTIEVMKGTIKSRDETIESRDKTIETLKGTIENQDKTIAGRDKTIKDLDQTIKHLEGKVQGRDETIGAIAKERDDANRDAAIQSVVHKQTAAALELVVQQQQQQISDLDEDCEVLEGAIEYWEGLAIDELQDEVADWQTDYTLLEQEHERGKGKLQRLEREAEERERVHRAKLDTMEADLTGARSANHQFQELNKQLLTRSGGDAAQLERLVGELAGMTRERDALQGMHGRLQGQEMHGRLQGHTFVTADSPLVISASLSVALRENDKAAKIKMVGTVLHQRQAFLRDHDQRLTEVVQRVITFGKEMTMGGRDELWSLLWLCEELEGL